MKSLEDVIKPSQRKLFFLIKKLYAGNTVICSGRFILVKGKAPVLLVAHLDTVHRERVKNICKSEDGNILISPEGIGGDDRCGVYALVKTYEQAVIKPWLLFTCDEETGAAGARAFARKYMEGKLPQEMDRIKCIVELDRRGRNDAVYYDCANQDFEDYISSKGFTTAMGSFSDISLIAPAMGVAAVNLSSGYYNAHTQHEYIVRSHLEAVVEKVGEIVEEVSKDGFPRYDFVESRQEGFFSTPMPGRYSDLYDTLLEYYFPEELEECRATYGDGILQELYEDAFGVPYCRGVRVRGEGSDAYGSSWPYSEISQTTPHADRRDESGQPGRIKIRKRTEPGTDTMVYPGTM